MKTFGASGAGAFPAPLAVRPEIERLYGVELVDIMEGLSERYYAISTERRATDPQVVKILALAEDVLSDAPSRANIQQLSTSTSRQSRARLKQ